MSVHHSFDVDVAAKYGIEEAILIHHFQHWIRHNKSLQRNFHEGRTWSYQSLKEIAANFPYLNESKVNDILDKLCTGTQRKSKKNKLEFEPVLMKGNFNKSRYDRTVWYAFIDESDWILGNPKIEIAMSQNRNCDIPEPIPNTNHILKTYEEHPPTPPEGGKAPKVAGVAYGPHIKLKKEEYDSFCEDYGKQNIDCLFEEINDWISSGRGKPYKDFAAGIRTWIRKREWKKVEKGPDQLISPTIQPSRPKTSSEINREWFDKFLFYPDENYNLKKKIAERGRIEYHPSFINFIDLPEEKIYFDQQELVFQTRVQHAIKKLKN